MHDYIIIAILAVLLIVGVLNTIKHFRNKSGCCGSGNTYIVRKKLKKIIAKKTFIIEGMTCENCKARVERYINDMDGVVGKVNLKKKELVVSMEKEVSDEEFKAVVTKAGYEIVEIK